MIIPIAGPTSLSPHICQELIPLGANIAPSVTIARNLLFNGPIEIASNCDVFGAQIDAYSYLGVNASLITSKVGRYCSIGHRVEIGLGYHNYKLFTTSPAIFRHPTLFHETGDKIEGVPKWLEERQGMDTSQAVIGNDVWIGAHAMIPGDVTIGHGAVIGANAVITKDVPPYAIVSASTNSDRGQVVKYRFSDEIIADLLELNWWDYDLPSMLAQGMKIPRENVKDFISFMKNEDVSSFLRIQDNWKLLAVINSDKVQLVPGHKDMFMDFVQLELND